MKWCCNVVICWENVRSLTGDNSNTRIIYRDVIISLLRIFIAFWRIFISLFLLFGFSIFNRIMWARVEILRNSFVVNYLFIISFIVHVYHTDQYVLFLYLYCVVYTALIHVHLIRDSKLQCKSVEPCFVTLGIYERKNPKLILSQPFVLQCSLNNRN